MSREYYIKCEDCRGTGICAIITRPMGVPRYPHSCCTCESRKTVPADQVPEGFEPIYDGKAYIGTGTRRVTFWRWLVNRFGF